MVRKASAAAMGGGWTPVHLAHVIRTHATRAIFLASATATILRGLREIRGLRAAADPP